ncbi:MAG: aminodeoxychorismate synthase component I, partial [Solibacillus isronensis]
MQQLETHTFYMTKDEFYYSFQEQTAMEKQRAFMESGRGGHYSIAAWEPIATAKSVAQGLE